MSDPGTWFLLITSLSFGALVVLAIFWGIHRDRQRRRQRIADAYPHYQPPPTQPHCGYNLTGIEIPRCPECSRAWGFDMASEQIGIREDDVRSYVRQRRREADATQNKGEAAQ
jgi:hypothetical protein